MSQKVYIVSTKSHRLQIPPENGLKGEHYNLFEKMVRSCTLPEPPKVVGLAILETPGAIYGIPGSRGLVQETIPSAPTRCVDGIEGETQIESKNAMKGDQAANAHFCTQILHCMWETTTLLHTRTTRCSLSDQKYKACVPRAVESSATEDPIFYPLIGLWDA